jgi:hypothetical protein
MTKVCRGSYPLLDVGEMVETWALCFSFFPRWHEFLVRRSVAKAGRLYRGHVVAYNQGERI